REKQRLVQSIRDMLDRDYQRAPENQRTEMILSWLSASEPTFKSVGAKKVLDEKKDGKRIPPEITAQLRAMIGDSDIEVRKDVVTALSAINDGGSVDPLLAQLAVESDPEVKIAIASTLARLQQLKAVDAL